jgi:repressor LexA
MGISENIKLLRQLHGLSQKEFGIIAGVSDKAVSTWENGTKEPRMGVIQKIADHFGLQKSNIIEDNGLDLNAIHTSKPAPAIQPVTFETLPVPLIGDIAAGTPINAEQNIQDYIPVNRAVVDRCNGECFCLKVEGSSMIPEICDGDIIVVDSVIDPSRINARDNIVVMIETTATVKHLSITEKGFLLTANNPDVYEPHFYDCDQVKKLPVIIAGKVVSLQRDF